MLWRRYQSRRRRSERSSGRSCLPAVEKTVAEQSQGATIKGFSTEIEKGKRVYEVAMDSLSQTVKDGLTKAAGTGTISKIESLTKNGTLVAYEAAVKRGAKHSEIQVGPNGEKLAHPE